MATPHDPELSAAVERWFAAGGRAPFAYQREVWAAHAAGESGLVHAPTGTGKTLAAWLALLLDPRRIDDGLSVLWITPMRALAADAGAGLQQACDALGVPWRVEVRTGDTSSAVRARQRRKLPNALVTTPESASLLLSYPDLVPTLRRLRAVVVDEWHELVGTKRGVQTELALAHLRHLAPELQTWGLSATLGNLDEAMATLLGPGRPGRRVRAEVEKEIRIETLLPATVERFPWAGHLGLGQLPQVVAALREAGSSLVFCNTRAQTERWYEALTATAPELRLALHHGSLDLDLRRAAEAGLRDGTLHAVIATSSLDLGVDFAPVEQVIQIGGPKGVARLLQRAGRSGHRPGRTSVVRCVATHAVELAEFAAVRRAAREGDVEARRPLQDSLDVLAQHVVTLALTSQFDAEAIRRSAASTHAYAGMTDAQWRWVFDFVSYGGTALAAYPQYRKVVAREDGILTVPDETIARRHRMSVGTITSDHAIRVAFVRGGHLGHVEESFVARLRPGDGFRFAGRALTLVRVKDMTAQVKAAKSATVIPRWQGGRMPLSSQVASHLLRLLQRAGAGDAPPRDAEDEMIALAPLLDVQTRWSTLPQPGRLLVERTRSREGDHLFVFPFAGRHVHEGLSALVAHRLTEHRRLTFSFSVNDYGFELLAPALPELAEDELRALFSLEDLDADLLASVNAVEMARRRFRDIARIAGLVFDGYPGRGRPVKHLQASAGLIYDTLRRYDPGNLLVHQALQEALDHQIDVRRLRETCGLLAKSPIDLRTTPRLTPLAFPLWAERISSSLSSEDWQTRITRMLASLEAAAGGDASGAVFPAPPAAVSEKARGAARSTPRRPKTKSGRPRTRSAPEGELPKPPRLARRPRI